MYSLNRLELMLRFFVCLRTSVGDFDNSVLAYYEANSYMSLEFLATAAEGFPAEVLAAGPRSVELGSMVLALAAALGPFGPFDLSLFGDW